MAVRTEDASAGVRVHVPERFRLLFPTHPLFPTLLLFPTCLLLPTCLLYQTHLLFHMSVVPILKERPKRDIPVSIGAVNTCHMSRDARFVSTVA